MVQPAIAAYRYLYEVCCFWSSVRSCSQNTGKIEKFGQPTKHSLGGTASYPAYTTSNSANLRTLLYAVGHSKGLLRYLDCLSTLCRVGDMSYLEETCFLSKYKESFVWVLRVPSCTPRYHSTVLAWYDTTVCCSCVYEYWSCIIVAWCMYYPVPDYVAVSYIAAVCQDIACLYSTLSVWSAYGLLTTTWVCCAKLVYNIIPGRYYVVPGTQESDLLWERLSFNPGVYSSTTDSSSMIALYESISTPWPYNSQKAKMTTVVPDEAEERWRQIERGRKGR